MTERRPRSSRPTSGNSPIWWDAAPRPQLPQRPLPPQVDVADRRLRPYRPVSRADAGARRPPRRRVRRAGPGRRRQLAQCRLCRPLAEARLRRALMEHDGLERAITVYPRHARRLRLGAHSRASRSRSPASSSIAAASSARGRAGSMIAWRASTRCASGISASRSRCCRAPIGARARLRLLLRRRRHSRSRLLPSRPLSPGPARARIERRRRDPCDARP